MSLVMVVPGVMGSELWHQTTQAWPPEIGHAGIHKRSADDLLKFGTEARNILAAISAPKYGLHASMYAGVVDLLRDVRANYGHRYRIEVCFYDWRLGIAASAESLRDRLDEVARTGEDIAIVAHSMGGLVTRYMIEQGITADRKWAKSLCRVIFMATPHYGAPLAIQHITDRARAKGLKRGAPADLGLEPGMLASYELMPNPTHLDFGLTQTEYAQLAIDLNLDPHNWANCWRPGRPLGSKPRKVEYFNVVCTGQTTFTKYAIPVDPRTGLPEPFSKWQDQYDKREGDGTVPYESQLADFTIGAPNVSVLAAKHDGVLAHPSAHTHLEPVFAEWLRPPFCAPFLTQPSQTFFAAPTPQDPLSPFGAPPTPSVHVYGFESPYQIPKVDSFHFSWRVERGQPFHRPDATGVTWTTVAGEDDRPAHASEVSVLGGLPYARGETFRLPGVYRLTTKVTAQSGFRAEPVSQILFVGGTAAGGDQTTRLRRPSGGGRGRDPTQIPIRRLPDDPLDT